MLRGGSSYKRHPVSLTVICRALHELYDRHIPVCRLKLKHLHPNTQNEAHIARESACLLYIGFTIDTLLSNSRLALKYLDIETTNRENSVKNRRNPQTFDPMFFDT